MTAQTILGGISQEETLKETLDTLVFLLSTILKKLPRLDSNERAVINTTDQGNVVVALAASQNLNSISSLGTVSSVTAVTTVSTVTAVNTLQNMGTSNRPADQIPTHMSQAGSMHIYNNIIVS